MPRPERLELLRTNPLIEITLLHRAMRLELEAMCEATRALAAAPANDGAALADPARLAPFEVVAFADLKRHAYVYWFAFPALVLRPAAAATRGAPAPGFLEASGTWTIISW